MRVHELAKAAELTSAEILALCKRHRVAVKQSANANIEDKDVRKLWKYIEDYKTKRAAEEEEKRKREEEEKRRKEEEKRLKEEERRRRLEEKRRQEEEERRRKEEEERKRREEEERKRREEEQERRRREEEERKKREEEEKRRKAAEAAQQAAVGAPASQPHPPRQKPQPAASGPKPGRGEKDKPGGEPSKKLDLKNFQIPVMVDLGRPRRTDKLAKKDAKTKRCDKPRPTKLFELEEDMTVTSRPGKGKRAPEPVAEVLRPTPAPSGPPQPKVRKLSVDQVLTVAQFADRLGVPATEVIKKVLLAGERLTLNQDMSPELMELIAMDFGVELEFVLDTDEYDLAKYLPVEAPENMRRRPPVVTIMGHVDHGKTTLLDRIRKSNIVDGEFGGITQHIGAYHVSTTKGDIVFLDTPGHEAFTSMRARGASVTDIVILVVAANDGFQPQTVEAIHHAQAAKVPIVVAVNKIDVPGADPQRVRQEALQYSLVPEELGGETIFVDISAKHGTNVDQLLELVALQAEILDLKADPTCNAQGTIIESHVDPQRGPVATVLVQKGTLRLGDPFVVGDISGRVRAMMDDRGRNIREAGPSFPAEIIGLDGAPNAGEIFLVVPDERIARVIAEKRKERRRRQLQSKRTQHVTLEKLHDIIAEGKIKELNIILKADVQGSVEAISEALQKLASDEIRINILHAAVGGINESDINLADASDAVIIGFNVRPDAKASELAHQQGVEIKTYRIIYDLLNDMEKAMLGMLEPKYEEKVLGHAEVRQTFRIAKVGTVAGCYVRDGEIPRDALVRVLRDNVIVYEGKLSSLKRYKDDVKRVQAGEECGLGIENFNDIKDGDVIEAYQMIELKPVLTRSGGEDSDA